MRFIRHSKALAPDGSNPASVVTIGAYDGLHIGHQQILKRVRAIADDKKLRAVVVSFEPTPKEFFSRSTAPARLMRFREKFVRLRQLGIDLFCCPRFDASLANASAGEFTRQLLVDQLNAKVVVIGDDFRFARDRSGNVETLIQAGEKYGFSVVRIGSILADGQRISSTAVRSALARGDMSGAARLLGRAFRMSGRVIAGKKLGRTLGFPTANLAVRRRVSPVHGIYAVRVSGAGNGALDAVASIGTRPTVSAGPILLEVFIFDFNGDLYGKELCVDFIAFLREERKFPDLDSLVQQMKIDCVNARRILTSANEES